MPAMDWSRTKATHIIACMAIVCVIQKAVEERITDTLYLPAGHTHQHTDKGNAAEQAKGWSTSHQGHSASLFLKEK